MARWLLVVVAVFVAAPARADFVYSYESDTFLLTQGVYQPNQDRITGSFVLSDDFLLTLDPERGAGWVEVISGITSYSFTDGHQTLTETNSTAFFGVPFHQDGTPITPGAQSSFFDRWRFSITTPMSGLEASYNVGWGSVAWMGGPAPSSYVVDYTTGERRLVYTDPSIPTMRIDSFHNATLIGGLPGTWAVTVPEPSSLLLLSLGVPMLLWRRHQGTSHSEPTP